jgi:putative PEP-CTERM system integral membrane protein
MNKQSRPSRILNFFSRLFFWGFNTPIALVISILIFNVISSLSKQGNIIQNLKQATLFIPIDILITILVVLLMPITSIIVAIASKSNRQPTKLLQILFGVELPILAFTLARLVFLKTLTPVNILFLTTAAISIFSYAVYIFKKSFKNKFWLTIHTLAHQAAFVIGLYASLLMFFFVPIIVAWLVAMIISFFGYGLWESFRYSSNFWQAITGFLFSITFPLFLIFLIFTPFAGLLLYMRSAKRLSKNIFKPNLSRWIFSITYLLIMISLAYQGSMFSFYNNIKAYKSANTFENRSHIVFQILEQDDFVKNRLTDIYLANYQYLTDRKMTLLLQAYTDQLKIDQPTAKKLQDWFTKAAFPFVYNGKFEEDVKNAGEYYQDIFDEPIQLAQSKKVIGILSSSFNFSTDQMKSSVLDREDKDVRLVHKTITAKPDSTNQFATVTIEEEYENITNSEQEVLYVFSLPQDSVMTDLKLGADLKLDKEQLETNKAPSNSQLVIPQPITHKDQGEVAAKGAANQTFETQYSRRVDPAILEQVGPVQYKLRVYPIPVKEENLNQWQRANLIEPVKNQKVRYSYITPIDANGQVALPNVTEKRNLFDDKNESAKSVSVISKNSKVCGTQPVKLLNNSQTIYYIPHQVNPWIKKAGIAFNCQSQFKGMEEKIKNNRIAILADSSYSMNVKDWKSYLNKELPLESLLNTNIVDLYYFNDLVSKPINLNEQQNNPKAWEQAAFGKTDRLQALKNIEGKYDLVLMFTDGSEADNPSNDNSRFSKIQPIYIIYKDGKKSKSPDNLTYYLQANGSRVVSSGQEALQNFSVYQAVKKDFVNDFVLVGESGTWIVSAKDLTGFSALALKNSDPIGKIAIHRQIESEIKNVLNNSNQLELLDKLNQSAQSTGIVTPFSSFIVLVTLEQKEQLKQASLSDGRYSVNYDLGEETLIDPASGGMLGTSAVPEPHEWILIFVGLGLVLFLSRRKAHVL